MNANRDPQKALHLYLDEDKKNPKHVGETYAVMEKFDGWYMFIDCINGVWQDITSRNMNVISSMSTYTAMFKERVPAPKRDARLIFEGIVCHQVTGYPMEFKTVNGWFNRKAPLHMPATLQCHDLIIFGDEEAPFKFRYEHLKAMFRAIDKKDPTLAEYLKLVPTIAISDDPTVWKGIYEDTIRKYNCTGEGVILKRVDAPYSYKKKNADILKIKCENTFELKVVGIEVGEGKYKDTLGKLVVSDAHGVINKVSGMSDSLRDLWWGTPSLIVGKVVEVACMKVLSNKSLREGRFKAVRHDKDEIDAL